MIQTGANVSGISAYLLSQAVNTVKSGVPVDQQSELDKITNQASEVAQQFAEFVAAATTSLDICIYDFRLTIPSIATTIIDAINDAAERGVTVRIAYDKNQEDDQDILKQFQSTGGDPAPVGTSRFLTAPGRFHPAVAIKPIAEEAIDPHGRIMHNKYMVRDAATDQAAVWMGSTNFTVDAWALQENNIVVLEHTPQVAAGYTSDFDELWATERIATTGTTMGSGTVGSSADGLQVSYAFAPGHGHDVETLIAKVISGATKRIRVASMVLSSPTILQALKDQIDKGTDLTGIYDYGETMQVRKDWQKYPADADKIKLLDAVTAKLVAKHSVIFSAEEVEAAQNFMHNKIVVGDDQLATGSFNFSTNATHNAENVVSLTNESLAGAYASYVDGLVERYASGAAPRS